MKMTKRNQLGKNVWLSFSERIWETIGKQQLLSLKKLADKCSLNPSPRCRQQPKDNACYWKGIRFFFELKQSPQLHMVRVKMTGTKFHAPGHKPVTSQGVRKEFLPGNCGAYFSAFGFASSKALGSRDQNLDKMDLWSALEWQHLCFYCNGVLAVLLTARRQIRNGKPVRSRSAAKGKMNVRKQALKNAEGISMLWLVFVSEKGRLSSLPHMHIRSDPVLSYMVVNPGWLHISTWRYSNLIPL